MRRRKLIALATSRRADKILLFGVARVGIDRPGGPISDEVANIGDDPIITGFDEPVVIELGDIVLDQVDLRGDHAQKLPQGAAHVEIALPVDDRQKLVEAVIGRRWIVDLSPSWKGLRQDQRIGQIGVDKSELGWKRLHRRGIDPLRQHVNGGCGRRPGAERGQLGLEAGVEVGVGRGDLVERRDVDGGYARDTLDGGDDLAQGDRLSEIAPLISELVEQRGTDDRFDILPSGEASPTEAATIRNISSHGLDRDGNVGIAGLQQAPAADHRAT